ncbi:hypothetical protein HZB05_01390 [Candidatus Wolfebacteria bacterium]|nr:hypothetical protein [Candidatus Wolfebacteria bacterium]
MTKINKILLTLIIILLVSLGFVIFWQKIGYGKSYYAVYMSTGDLYFGKLGRFPKLVLTDVWFLQKNNDAQNPYALSKFDKAFWTPEDKLYLNSKNIIWMTEIKENSQLTEFFKNPQLSEQQKSSAIQQAPFTTSTP